MPIKSLNLNKDSLAYLQILNNYKIIFDSKRPKEYIYLKLSNDGIFIALNARFAKFYCLDKSTKCLIQEIDFVYKEPNSFD